MTTAIQVIEHFNSEADAAQCFDAMTSQDGYIGGRILAPSSANPSWLGDWIAYGERRYGETYSQAIKVTGRQADDLANMVSVAVRVPFSSRNEHCSWSHHAAVASLKSPDEQRKWLKAAAENEWTSSELREQINRGKGVALRAPSCKRCGTTCTACERDIQGGDL